MYRRQFCFANHGDLHASSCPHQALTVGVANAAETDPDQLSAGTNFFGDLANDTLFPVWMNRSELYTRDAVRFP